MNRVPSLSREGRDAIFADGVGSIAESVLEISARGRSRGEEPRVAVEIAGGIAAPVG